MHGTWTGDHTEAPEGLTKSAVFNWTEPRQPFEWNLDYGKLMKLALLIDQCIFDILNGVVLSNSDPTKFGTLDDALQRIRHTPRQT